MTDNRANPLHVDWRHHLPGSVVAVIDLVPRMIAYIERPVRTLEIGPTPTVLDFPNKFLTTYAFVFISVSAAISSLFAAPLDVGLSEQTVTFGFQRINEMRFYDTVCAILEKGSLIASVGLAAFLFGQMLNRHATFDPDGTLIGAKFDPEAWRVYLFYSASVMFVPNILVSQYLRLHLRSYFAANANDVLGHSVMSISGVAVTSGTLLVIGLLLIVPLQWIVIPIVVGRVLNCRAPKVLWVAWLSNAIAAVVSLGATFAISFAIFAGVGLSRDELKDRLVWRYPDEKPIDLPARIELRTGKDGLGRAVLTSQNVLELKRLVETLTTNRGREVYLLRVTSHTPGPSPSTERELVLSRQLRGYDTAASPVWLWLNARNVRRMDEVTCEVTPTELFNEWRYRALIFVGKGKPTCSEALNNFKLDFRKYLLKPPR